MTNHDYFTIRRVQATSYWNTIFIVFQVQSVYSTIILYVAFVCQSTLFPCVSGTLAGSFSLRTIYLSYVSPLFQKSNFHHTEWDYFCGCCWQRKLKPMCFKEENAKIWQRKNIPLYSIRQNPWTIPSNSIQDKGKITGPWNIGHCGLHLFWSQMWHYTISLIPKSDVHPSNSLKDVIQNH